MLDLWVPASTIVDLVLWVYDVAGKFFIMVVTGDPCIRQTLLSTPKKGRVVMLNSCY